MTSLRGPTTRIALREVRRDHARNALVVLLIMIPVSVVVGAAILARTASLSVVESLPRELGAADASLQLLGYPMVQCPDTSCSAGSDAMAPPVAGLTAAQAIPVVLGSGTRVLELPSQDVQAQLDGTVVPVLVTEADLGDPMLAGRVGLRAGRAPTSPGEVAVTDPLVERGATIGSTLDLGTFGPAHVVGVVASDRTPNEAFAAPGGLGVPFLVDDVSGGWYSRWLVTTPGGVSWQDVLDLNAYGIMVLSREVVENPPTPEQVASDAAAAGVPAHDAGDSVSAATVAVVTLCVGLALLEIVFLAGPAFAVGAARQSRALGLLATQGATPRHLRRVMLAQAVALGGVGAVTGAVVAVVGTRAAYPLLHDATNGRIGPFEVNGADVALVVAFGLLSAVAAAVVPARAVARMDPVRALAGRRPQPKAVRRHTLLGTGLVATGTGVALAGARSEAMQGVAAVAIAAGAVLAVVGAAMVAPATVAVTARIARRAPLALRYASRDMDRNQLRTVPAVAAVTTVVASAVALGIGASSDNAEAAATYVMRGPVGDAVVHATGPNGEYQPPEVWADLLAGATAGIPGSQTTTVPGVADVFSQPEFPGDTVVLTSTDLLPPDMNQPAAGDSDPGDSDPGGTDDVGSTQLAAQAVVVAWYRSALLVGVDGLAGIAAALDDAELDRARDALADGLVVVLSIWDGPSAGTVRLDRATEPSEQERADGAFVASTGSTTVPAVAVRMHGVSAPALAVLPEATVAAMGVAPVVAGAVLDAPHDLTAAEATALETTLSSVGPVLTSGGTAYLTVERGWHGELGVALLVLSGAATALVLAGSITASLLALSDARPDFATLGAVGAAPRLRRRIAGSYGWLIGTLGAVVGTAVGFVPGVSIAVPLTAAPDWPREGLTDLHGVPLPDVFVAVPWTLLVLLVIGLPLVVALVLSATTRSRLPLRARLE